MVELRLATRADAGALRELDDLARAGDTERVSLIGKAVADRRCLVAERGGLLGYAVVVPGHFFGHDFVELVIVGGRHRRRGIGRSLLRAAVEHAATPRVFSSTNESNTAMRALFDTEGWTRSGRLVGLDADDPELVYFVDRDG